MHIFHVAQSSKKYLQNQQSPLTILSPILYLILQILNTFASQRFVFENPSNLT